VPTINTKSENNLHSQLYYTVQSTDGHNASVCNYFPDQFPVGYGYILSFNNVK